jgi:aldehyde dehydrogenase (NAD+)
MTVSHQPGPAATTNTAEDDFGAAAVVEDLRRAFDTGRTRSYHWRVEQLRALKALCSEREDEICDALAADLGKPRLEGFSTEVAYTIGAVDYTIKHLKKWMAPRKVPTPLVTQPGKSHIHSEPLGVVLIISPWNYPFQLCTVPLVGALAAGNCALLKPSEVTPETSALLARLVPQYLDTSCVRVFEGGVPETTAVLDQRFDHIMYTGNGTVGRIVMAAAAKHLTPVTLELGGKSPVIVNDDANIDVAAKRIVWGKFSNAGQTCVAPDYVLVHRDVHDVLVTKMADAVRDFYGHDPQTSKDFGRVVNERHHRRLMALLDSGDIVVGGEADEADRYIAPTILKNVSPDSPVMQDEIFGPILPVLGVDDVNDAVRFINARPKPLALYVYSEDEGVGEDVVARTSSGGVTINHAWMHLAVPELPFGGVGESGMGAYHGRASFDTFSHQKSVLTKPTAMDPPIMYPPYTSLKEALLRRLL